MNSIQIIGRLTKDPELTTTTGGHSLCRMRVAIPRPTDTEDPVFIDVVSWDRLAHSCEAHLSQGRQVAVCGRLDYSEWSDDEGAKHSRHDIVATSVNFLSQPKAKEAEAG